MTPQKLNVREAPSRTQGRTAGHPADPLDLKILALLLANARASAREIAGKLGVSTSTVIARMDSLRKSGILKGFTAELDYEKLGYELTVLTEIQVSKGKGEELGGDNEHYPGVCP